MPPSFTTTVLLYMSYPSRVCSLLTISISTKPRQAGTCIFFGGIGAMTYGTLYKADALCYLAGYQSVATQFQNEMDYKHKGDNPEGSQERPYR